MAILLMGLLVLAVPVTVSIHSPQRIRGVVFHDNLSRAHEGDALIAGGDLPPAGGVHFDRWQNCGIYDTPVETGNAVHSLEHGAVWITYDPQLPQEEIAALREHVRGEDYLLLSPYPGQRSPVVLTAWGAQLEIDSHNDERIAQFIAHYRQGPMTPELGSSCTGGVGRPIR